jgi:hypothetical protein
MMQVWSGLRLRILITYLSARGGAALLIEGANAPPKNSKTVDLVKISPYMHYLQTIFIHPQGNSQGKCTIL